MATSSMLIDMMMMGAADLVLSRMDGTALTMFLIILHLLIPSLSLVITVGLSMEMESE